MAITNRERVGKSLELLHDGIKPYVQRELEAECGQQRQTQAQCSLHKNVDWSEGDPHPDAHALLLIMWNQWNAVFCDTPGPQRAQPPHRHLRARGSGRAHEAGVAAWTPSSAIRPGCS